MSETKTPLLGLAALAFAVLGAQSCFDSGVRWADFLGPEPVQPACVVGEQRCGVDTLEQCEEGPTGPNFAVIDDCGARDEVCVASMLACKPCQPSARSCDDQDVVQCRPDASAADYVETCDPTVGNACRVGACVNLCALAWTQKSNLGCEYWAVDLDNAMINSTSNAAAQQFAVVVSNPQPDVPADLVITQDDGLPGDPEAPVVVATATLPPLGLLVFKLGPREVDGSAEGEYNKGTHTALTRHAYKITSSFPVVAYQFNPLENANVFSNDASLLKAREALTYEGNTMQVAYVVAGWPQTIARTDDPNTNFSAAFPIDLRAFLTIVGTRPNTNVRVRPKTTIIGGGPIPETPPGAVLDVVVGPYDVLNLETSDFNADFTGTIIEADGPIAVFSGGEASDAPHFETLADRRCCADHLEDQLDPVRTAGKTFAVPHTPSRTRAVSAAGALTGVVPEPDFVRFVAVSTKGAIIQTSLPPPDDEIFLDYQGDFREITAYGDFVATSTEPIAVAQVMASQDAAGVKRGLPGGDPSLLIVPPIEQFRPNYVFLTPDKYAFDFITIVAPASAEVQLDDVPLVDYGCEVLPTDGLTEDERGGPPVLLTYNCQLSFPEIDPVPNPPVTTPGLQNDGVHRILASAPVGAFINGFDNYVSYSYAGGTELREIAVPE